MELSVKQAYNGVYCSSKEILCNNQRHLFCNMLDLLSRTCKTTGIAGNNLSADQIKFWLIDILPLIFDDELPIQTSAITSFSHFIKALDIANVQKSSYWLEVKGIVCSSAPKIHKLRDSQNSNWFKTWCILLSVLDKEILKGSSTINSFLSIVELGFRSLNYTVRCEAFLCWRHLIEIFSIHNELCSAKRLKLICIPLKSSQPKTSNVAEIKLRVWWYLISKLENIETNFSTVVQPFLGFSFGAISLYISSSENINIELREMLLVCLTAIITKTKCEFIDNNLSKQELELIPAHFISTSIFEKHWNSILRAVIEAIKLVEIKFERHQMILQILIQNAFHYITECEKWYIYDFFFEELIKLLPCRDKPAVQVLKIIAMDNMHLKTSNVDHANYTGVLAAFIKFFIANNASVAKVIMQKCIHNVLFFNRFDDQHIEWKTISNVFHIILKTNVDEDFKCFETKLMMWICVSRYYLENLQKLFKDFQLCKEREETLNSWILWPLQTYISFQGHLSSFPSCFDLTFCAVWNQLCQSSQNSSEREVFLITLADVFKDILLNKETTPNFSVLFDTFAKCTLKLPFNSTTEHQIRLFELFNIWITMRKECLNTLLNTLKNTLDGLNSRELGTLIEDIKKTLMLIVKPEYQKYISKPLFEDFRCVLFEKLKTCANKININQIKDIFQRNDIFVVIPSVWSLNPDKLTDRQKEKYAQRSEIPALYNDMSQSQESFITPWTPKKVVIVTEAHDDIVQNKVVEIDKSDQSLHCISNKSTNKNDTKDEISKTKIRAKNSYKQITKLDEELLQEYNLCITDLQKNGTIVNNLRVLEKNIVDDETYSVGTSCRPKIILSASDGINEAMTKIEYSSVPLYDPGIDESLKINSTEKACNVRQQLQVCELKLYDNQNFSSIPSTEELNQSHLVSANVEPKTCEKHFNMPNENSDKKLTAELKDDKENNWIGLKEPLNMRNNDAKLKQNVQSEVTQQLSITQLTTNTSGYSTKLSIGKNSFLSSPPDRKITNNSNSPNIKPKASSRLTGRGAQLINMIRNKRYKTSPNLINPFELTKTFTGEIGINSVNVPTTICDKTCSSSIETLTHSNNCNKSTDILLIPKPLPSPTASPSASILKRKFRCDSFDDSGLENLAKKKKRVSFHDPPVSTTKEFIADEDKINTNLHGYIILGKNGAVQNLSLKNRKIENKGVTGDCFEQKKSTQVIISSPKGFMAQHGCSLKYENNTDISFLETSLNSTNDLSSINSTDILNYVTKQFTLENILATFLTEDNSLTLKSVSIILKILANAMKVNPKIKVRVLENLSEIYSKDFLEHAVQENLSSVICEQLHLKSIIDFICEKSKVNTLCRNILLAHIPEIFTKTKLETDQLKLIQNLLQTSCLTDENILFLIEVLVRKRVLREVVDGSESS